MYDIGADFALNGAMANGRIVIIKDIDGKNRIIPIQNKKFNTTNLKKQCENNSTIRAEENNNTKKDTNVSKFNKQNLPGLFNGSFNEIKYTIKEQNTLLFASKKYIGTINGKDAEFIVNLEQGKFHKGKIQGYINNSEVNMIVSSDLFGKKTITGLYKGEQIELNVSKDLFGTHIEGENTNISIKKNFFNLNKSIDGKFGFADELVPLILSYIKYSEDGKKDSALSA